MYRSIQKGTVMELHLKDKVAVVTGAGKGIGLAVVEALAREGVKVVAGSRSSTPEQDALAASHDVTIVAVDLSTPKGAETLVQQAVERHQRLDILVNNVGAAEPRDGFLGVSDADRQGSSTRPSSAPSAPAARPSPTWSRPAARRS
jgi:NAD(P)-dependent dehydrogenase (short-subunit alcohol dehydrogenase family)